MKNWVPLHCHSHYSLLDGSSKPAQIAERCTELGYTACALTDHGNIAGSVSFMKAMKGVCKCGQLDSLHENKTGKCRLNNGCMEFRKSPIKPILGCEFYLCADDPSIKNVTNATHAHLCVLAKNLNGWRNLIQSVSYANNPDFFYRKPRLSLEKLSPFAANGNLIAFSGHIGSELANIIFIDPKAAYSAKTYEEAKALVRTDWEKRTTALAGKYVEIFGKQNFFIEIQLIDAKNIPAAEIIAKILRHIAKKNGWNCLATADSHYPSKEDAGDQRVLLCSSMETTLREIREKAERNEEVGLGGFFRSNNYHIPSLTELETLHTDEELSNSLAIAEMCEDYKVTGEPALPTFACPGGMAPDDYLREMCIQGWNTTIKPGLTKDKHKIYGDRIKMELGVFKDAGLASYFLIVQDYCNYARSKGWLLSPGRGSGAGCMVSALVGITDKIVDPIEYGLLFERFYNAGRNAPGRVSLPDIDCDFPIKHREEMIQYIRERHGVDRVAQMVTFSRMQGRGAMKDVLRAHEACSFDEMNRITEFIPDEAEISDELQLMREETGEASIIKWALENNGEKLKQWAFLTEEGTLDGPYAKLFEQAIRLEGTKRGQGKHAAGVVISATPLAEVCPMIYDKSSGLMIAGMEMGDLEAMGHVKFDILGVAVLDKIMGVQELAETGMIEGE